MIRCSVNNDREGIISLWHESFGDNRKEIEFFLDNKYIPGNTVVCEENGKIISQLFLLDGEMHINGEDYPSYYLYAACTSKECRGKGIMGKMLEFARNLAYDRGIYFICLMPAEESLYNYYSNFGYKTAFKRKIIKLTVDELKKFDLSQNTYSDFSLKTPEKSRNCAFCDFDYFKWDEQSIEFAFTFSEIYGGNVIKNRKGYLLYMVDEECISVKENTFTAEILAETLIKLCIENKLSNVEINLPVDFDFYKITAEQNSNGMLLSVKNIPDKLNDFGYLGLTLD